MRGGDIAIGWVSTWNEKCGIAVHSENILKNLKQDFLVFAPYEESLVREDEGFVRRCWSKNSKSFGDLMDLISEEGVTKLVVQHHPGYMLFRDLNSVILKLSDFGVEVTLALHNTRERPRIFRSNRIDRAVPGMKLCKNVIVHQTGDVDRLHRMGVTENVRLVPLGVYPPPSGTSGIPIPEGRTLGTFGFLLPHKGFPELIQSFSMLEEWDYLVMLCSEREESADTLIECKERVKSLGLGGSVILNTEFLDQDVAISTLSELDLVVFPYQNTKESASAAIRMAVAAGSAIAVTPLEIFADVEGAIIMDGCSIEEMFSSLSRLQSGDLEDSKKNILEMRVAHQWPEISKRISDLVIE